MRTEKAWGVIREFVRKRSQLKAEWADRLKKAEEEIRYYAGEQEKAAEQKNIDAEIEALEKKGIASEKKRIIQERMAQACHEVFEIDESILADLTKEYKAELSELERKHRQAVKELFEISRKGYILKQGFIEVKNSLRFAETGERSGLDATDFLSMLNDADELTKEYRDAVDPVLTESVWHSGEKSWMKLVQKIQRGEYSKY